MTTNFITLSNVEERTDKRGNTYKQLTFTGNTVEKAVDPETGEEVPVIVPCKPASINSYASKELGPHTELFTLKPGARVAGALVTRQVEPYGVLGMNGQPPKQLNTYTAVVIGLTNEEDFEEKVKAAFRKARRPLVGDSVPEKQTLTDVPRVDLKAKKAEAVSIFE